MITGKTAALTRQTLVGKVMSLLLFFFFFFIRNKVLFKVDTTVQNKNTISLLPIDIAALVFSLSTLLKYQHGQKAGCGQVTYVEI